MSLEQVIFLAEVETDKATMELESYEDGVILYLSDKKKIGINETMAIIGTKGEKIDGLLEHLELNNREEKFQLKGDVGEVKMFAGKFLPENWLKCDGQTYKVVEKRALFDIIDYQYGGEGGSFKVPKIDSLSGIDYIICEKGN